MAMEPGGRADKLGNEYERLWVVYQLLRVLRNDVAAITWEPAGADGEGIDLSVELLDGAHSRQSCKRENGGHGKWTLAHLNGRGVLAAAKAHRRKASRPVPHISPNAKPYEDDRRSVVPAPTRHDNSAHTRRVL